MRNRKIFLTVVIFLIESCKLIAQQLPGIKTTESYFPEWKEIKGENIEWYRLAVPENWETRGKSLELAVAIIKAKNGNSNNPTVFIQGGPGGGSIVGINRWLKHPLRDAGDIILIDIRGTGFSRPSLCPDLGKAFFRVLAKNQSPIDDEKEKIKLSLLCQQELIDQGLDISTYNSYSVARDLNFLKISLGIKKWNIYGISYGTFIAQEYAVLFPEDVKTMILDSSIPGINQYYDNNTTNYISSLNSLFRYCRANPDCNKKFPDIERTYYSVIAELERNPITVDVDRNLIATGSFTYNAEDFKITIQQCLYQKKLIEILPLLIYQFHLRNKHVLSALVAAFSRSLSLDYGTYYCFICSEIMPKSSIDSFTSDANKYRKLNGGLDFYKSDYFVCSEWNKKNRIDTLTQALKSNNLPVLVFAGQFDPITPVYFAYETQKKYSNSTLIYVADGGHGTSFSDVGNKIVSEFIKGKNVKTDSETKVLNEEIHFITSVYLNSGVTKFANELNNLSLLFLAPLVLSIILPFGYSVSLIYKAIYGNTVYSKKYIFISAITSVLGVTCFILTSLAVIGTSKINYYILAFGLPGHYYYIFVLQKIFLICSVVLLTLSVLKSKSLVINKGLVMSIISIVIANLYFYYCGFYF